MASFYEPQQGADGFDQLVNYQLQKKREDHAFQMQAQREDEKEAQNNQRLNAFNLDKAYDPTKYHTSTVYNQIIDDKIAKAKKAGLDYLATNKPDPILFQKVLADGTQDIIAFQNNANAVEGKIKELGGVYKGNKFINQTAYENAIRKKALYDDKGNLLPPEKVDLDEAHNYVDNHPELYVADPVQTLQKNFLDPSKREMVTTSTFEKDAKGNKHSVAIKHWDLNYTGAPVADANGNYTLPILSEAFRDDDHNPIPGRMILAALPMANLMSNETNRKAIIALANKTYPDFDPSTKLGAQQMGEVAYNFIKQNARLGVSEVTRNEVANPVDLALKQQRLQNMQTLDLMREFALGRRVGGDDVKKKPDAFAQNWLGITKNDPNIITSKPIPVTVGNSFGGDLNNGSFGSEVKTINAYPISKTFEGGRYALGLNEDGRKVYAKEIYRTPTGLIVEDQDGKRTEINTPKAFSDFVHTTAPFNGSTPLKAAKIIDNNDNQQAPSLKSTITQKIKNVLGIKAKNKKDEGTQDEFQQYKRK